MADLIDRMATTSMRMANALLYTTGKGFANVDGIKIEWADGELTLDDDDNRVAVGYHLDQHGMITYDGYVLDLETLERIGPDLERMEQHLAHLRMAGRETFFRDSNYERFIHGQAFDFASMVISTWWQAMILRWDIWEGWKEDSASVG